MLPGWWTKARNLILPPQAGQCSTSSPKVRRMSSAQRM